MACSSCSKKNNVLSYFVSKVTPSIPTECLENEESVKLLESRVRCIMRTNKSFILNSSLGKLLSMINLGNYCKYNLTDITNSLDEYTGIC
jgi:hypothetical protein